jgi:hypothetical protein
VKRSKPLARRTSLARKAFRRERDTLGRGERRIEIRLQSLRDWERQPRRAVSPASREQRTKTREGCRVHGLACGAADPAHVVDRSIGGCDDELCVIPLCRMAHDAYDRHKLDLLPMLSYAEQAHAVAHLGLLRALKRITGRDWVERLGPETRL